MGVSKRRAPGLTEDLMGTNTNEIQSRRLWLCSLILIIIDLISLRKKQFPQCCPVHVQRAHSSWVSTPGMEEFSSLTLAPWGNWIILIIQKIIIWNGTHPYEPCMHNSCKLNVIGMFLPFFLHVSYFYIPCLEYIPLFPISWLGDILFPCLVFRCLLSCFPVSPPPRIKGA